MRHVRKNLPRPDLGLDRSIPYVQSSRKRTPPPGQCDSDVFLGELGLVVCLTWWVADGNDEIHTETDGL